MEEAINRFNNDFAIKVSHDTNTYIMTVYSLVNGEPAETVLTFNSSNASATLEIQGMTLHAQFQ